MSYVLDVVRDRPLALWPLSDTSPFQDVSGYNRAGSATGTTQSVSLVSQESASTVVSNGARATFDSLDFHQSFTLEAWVLPIGTSTSPQAILSHLGVYDGLTITGTVVSFTTTYVTAEDSVVSYDVVTPQALHVVGVHNSEKNQLYINGEMVIEIDLTDEQQADTLGATGDLVAGETTGTGKLAMNGVAIYSKPLSEDEVLRHFEAGRNVLTAEEVAEHNSGVRIALSSGIAGVFLEHVWQNNIDWNTGEIVDMTVMDDIMVPVEPELEPSLPGTWEVSVPLIAAAEDEIFGVNMDWDADGAVVEASINGTTWEVAQRKKNLGIIPAGFNPINRTVVLINYIKNSDFEVDTTLWSVTGGALDRVAGSGKTGDYYGTLTATGTGIVTAQTDTTSTAMPVVPNDVVSVSFYARQEVGLRTASARIRWRDSANAIVGTEVVSAPVTLTTEWDTRVSVTGTAPAGAAYAETRIVADAGAAGDKINIDAVQAVKAAEPVDPFNGDTTQDDEYIYTWQGTPHASLSEKSTLAPVELQVRVSFPGGIEEDDSYISSLTVTGYSSDVLPDIEDRTFTVVTPASFGGEYEPIQYRSDNGIALLTGGSITIGPDTSDEQIQPRTIELWIKRTGTPSVTPTSGRTIYLNGKSAASALTNIPVGEWALVHIVYTSGVSSNIVISGDIVVGQVVLYEDALTTTEIAEVYTNYTGKQTFANSVISTVDMSDAPAGTSIHAHNWSITGGGA